MPNLHARSLARAAQIVGGVDRLARELGLQARLLEQYIRGDLPVPADLFLKATDIITAAAVLDAAKSKSQSIPAK